MTFEERELLVAQVILGHFCFRHKGSNFKIEPPSPQTILGANHVYFEELRDAQFQGLYSKSETITLLCEMQRWGEQQEKELAQHEKNIEDFTFGVYNLVFKSQQREQTRKYLRAAEVAHSSLLSLKNSLFQFTSEHVASAAKTRYLIGHSLYRADNSPYWVDEDAWEQPDDLVDKATELYFSSLLSEAKVRELARTEPWRGLWTCRKSGSPVFDVPTIRFTIDQKNLILWTNLYESINESSEPPPDDFLEDDDVVDGWLIAQTRKRKSGMSAKFGESFTQNERIKNSEEVYIVAQSKEDISRVAALNDPVANATKKMRMNTIKERGVVNELDMPDTKQRLRLEAAQKLFGGQK